MTSSRSRAVRREVGMVFPAPFNLFRTCPGNCKELTLGQPMWVRKNAQTSGPIEAAMHFLERRCGYQKQSTENIPGQLSGGPKQQACWPIDCGHCA